MPGRPARARWNRRTSIFMEPFIMPITASARRAAYVIIAIAALLFLANYAARANEPTEPNANDPAGALDDAQIKRLPDVRALVGSDPITLDLKDAGRRLCEDESLDALRDVDPNRLVWSIITQESEIVDLELEGDDLKLAWKPDAVGQTTIVLKASSESAPDAGAFVSFRAEAWKPNLFAAMMAALGGGGLFLLGMKRMSDGLQAIAGSRLRRLVSIFTNNRFLAIGVGTLVTSIIQSSTATSVMTLGLVNSGLMTLKQAIGVLLGANIGTTTTGWIFALNVGAMGLPLLGVAAIFYLFCKNERVKNFSVFALGLGMIFFGLETLKAGLAPLPDTPQFMAVMRAFQATSFKGLIMCVFIGCGTTALVHSSSATVALIITLASLGVMDLNTAAALALGSNIGTALTPLIVAIGAPSNTRRAAYFHLIFNTTGVLWVMAIFFPIFLPLVERLGTALHLGITGQIALTHTLFNVANTIVFLPFLGPIANFLERRVVDKETRKPKSVTGLFSFLNDEPALAIERSRIEVHRMFINCMALGENLQRLNEGEFGDDELVARSFELEEKLDVAQDETIDFISQIMPRAFSVDATASAREQIRIAEEVETISDYLVGVLKSILKLKENEQKLPEELVNEFTSLLNDALDALKWLEQKFAERQHVELARPINERRRAYVANAKRIREKFMEDMSQRQFDPLVVIAVNYQINAWRRVYEHLLNIAEAMETPEKAVNPRANATRALT